MFDLEELPESFRTFGKLDGTLIFTISFNQTKNPILEKKNR